jgi:myo-inositol-1(or 4)-monophosphatase
MGDVEFGYVLDLGTEEEWVARRGEGVLLGGEPLREPPPERRTREGKLEVVVIESADPRWIAPHMGRLEQHVHRIRALGSAAISLCQVADTRADGMLTLWNTRAVDSAASQLIVRESGGHVVFPGCGDGPLDCPLDLEPHAPVVGARTQQGVDDLLAILAC